MAKTLQFSNGMKRVGAAYTIGSSDQDTFTRGVRDLPGKEKCDDGRFFEVEHGSLKQRDPEESQHNEAGERIVNQGDLELEELESL